MYRSTVSCLPGLRSFKHCIADEWMDQYQGMPPPTAMHWDCNGELCAEDSSELLAMLQAQEIDSQNQELSA
jgi:hypothetical protein